jgi:tetratricopeptide (TPR) repeat protein
MSPEENYVVRFLMICLSACGLAWVVMSVPADEPKTESKTEPKTEPCAEPAANEPAPRGVALYPGLSGYTRQVTTHSAEAQRWFDQGIQLLYGFNHDEAIRSFEKAAEIDPSCGMAWWGSAYARGLHINNPEMGAEQSRLAHEAAQKALAALDDETPFEQALVRAVGKRYEWPAPEDRSRLDQAYADAMEAVWHQFPGDPDAGALFAESLMNLQPWDLWTSAGVPKGRAMEVLAVLERTLRVRPDHPGANHLYIHAIEASPWPEKGVEAAERLQSLVPGSGHLVHMPSHIFIRVGRYADAAAANERAIAADEAYFALAPPPDFYSLYFMHNIHFLAYAAMMEGRYEAAMAAARKIETNIPPEFLRKNAVFADGFMPTGLHVMIRFGKWDEILAEPEPPAWRLVSRAERHFARSVAFSALGKTDEARREIGRLDRVAENFTDEWKVGNNTATEVIAVARAMADGELAYREGRAEEAFAHLRRAVALEEQLRYDEPPGWMQPVRHALGALLLADGRPAEAEAVYRADLLRHPANAWSLLGLQQALGQQGKTDEAGALAEKVQAAWARADVKPVASCYCHPAAHKQDP